MTRRERSSARTWGGARHVNGDSVGRTSRTVAFPCGAHWSEAVCPRPRSRLGDRSRKEPAWPVRDASITRRHLLHRLSVERPRVLPPSTVTQAAASSSPPGAVGNRPCTVHAIAPMRINTNKGWRLTHKYLPEPESPRGESGLHRRSPDLTPELQRAVWADEVVVAAQELEMFFELVLRARMGERSPRQIGRALSDGEIHPFNEPVCRMDLATPACCTERTRAAANAPSRQ